MTERRRADDSLMPQIVESLARMESALAENTQRTNEIGDAQAQMREQIAENTRRTNAIYAETRDVVEIMNKGKGFFAVCDWIAGRVKNIAIWFAFVGAVIAGAYEYIKHRWFK